MENKFIKIFQSIFTALKKFVGLWWLRWGCGGSAWGCGGSVRGCGGSVVERQATNPVVPGSNPGQSLQYQKTFLGTVKWQVKMRGGDKH